MDSTRVIDLRNVSIFHSDRGRSRRDDMRDELVLSDVDLRVDAGEFVYLIGRVGSGKSTLLKTLYAEVDLRRSMGIVFQDYQLLVDRNVFDNLYDVMRATGWSDESAIRSRIDEVLHLVNLEQKYYKMPFELSGGEQQRLVIARALLNSPRLLLADEPTGNLDPVTADGIMELFKRIAADGCAVVMSTHNISLIEQYPSRTILFSQGRIREVDMQTLLSQAEV